MKNIMKHSIIAGVILLFGMSSCQKEVAEVQIQMSLDKVTISEGQSVQLTAAVSPEEHTNSLEWSTLDPSVATVSDGLVTAVASGETYVKATVGEVSKGCLVTVIASVSGVTLDKDELWMAVNDAELLTAVVTPQNALNKDVTWESSKPSVATVINGTVSAVGLGDAVITVRTADGGHTAECVVHVIAMPESISLNKSEMTLNAGESETLTVELFPEEAVYILEWTTDDESVVTVSSEGVVTAISKGTATIRVTTLNGLTAECVVEVIVPVSGVTLDHTEIELYMGERKQLTATVLPAESENKAVIWTSDNEEVAAVTKDGMVVGGSKEGETVIRVTTEDGGFTASCKVTVKRGDLPADGVKLDKEKVIIVVGRTYDVIATVTPLGAGDKNVIWSVSDGDVASVASVAGFIGMGRITALKSGTTTVTATVVDGTHKASCTVTVVDNDSQLPGYGDNEYGWID
ncbi:MAG: hypothetical protein E7117_05265 [Bacteroidales bacterium]|nr:hypothetical protein [Bacteroidales bacterium]